MKKITYANAPIRCDVCHDDFGNVMYDASVRGRWGNLCQKCFTLYNCSLGLGRGQKYEKQADNSWLKTGG
jgi:hypothetical protein